MKLSLLPLVFIALLFRAEAGAQPRKVLPPRSEHTPPISVVPPVGTAAAQPAKQPISRVGLVKALKINELTAADLVGHITARGVDFRLTPTVRDELVAAGATPEVIEAVRANYRAPAGVAAAGAAARPAAPAKGDDDDDDDDGKEAATPVQGEATAPAPAPGRAAEGGCSFGPPPGTYTNQSPPSEGLFKREIYERYEWRANGTVNAPLRVGLDFLSLQVAKPYTNTVSVVPGRGAQRINDAAPVNAAIYRVAARYVVCEEYRDATARKLVEDKWECWIGRDGEWTCGASDPLNTKTTVLDKD